jgi:cell division septum initiation protein DivIVA
MSYLIQKEYEELLKEIIDLKQKNLKLLTTIHEYEELIEEYKSNFKLPDDSQGESTSFYDDD